MVTVEIWSDFACPFCLIGKRQFEQALAKFSDKDSVQVIYKSFQLDPKAPTQTDKNIFQILSDKYGRDEGWAQQMTENVVNRAKECGIEMNMAKIIPTNTRDAHRLALYAQQLGLQDQVLENIFSAYFIEGKNISSHDELLQIAESAGLDKEETRKILESEQLVELVREDQNEARQIGVQGVPFFAFNREFAVSGAQSSDHFIRALEKAVSDAKLSE